MHPWQQITAGSGLMLHAPLSVPLDVIPLQREFAALDRSTGDEGRMHLAEDGSWSSITLIDRRLSTAEDRHPEGTRMPALQAMPSAARLMERLGGRILSCYVHRQAPGGFLRWHYDTQALHLDECRLIVPLHAPPGAVTLIGDEAVAYPEGVVWTGDFTFPHQVENAPSGPRIVLLIDARCDDGLRALAPAALSAEPGRRVELAGQAVSAFLQR